MFCLETVGFFLFINRENENLLVFFLVFVSNQSLVLRMSHTALADAIASNCANVTEFVGIFWNLQFEISKLYSIIPHFFFDCVLFLLSAVNDEKSISIEILHADDKSARSGAGNETTTKNKTKRGRGEESSLNFFFLHCVFFWYSLFPLLSLHYTLCQRHILTEYEYNLVNIINSTVDAWRRLFFISRLSSFISSYRLYDLCLRELRIHFLSEYLNFSGAERSRWREWPDTRGNIRWYFFRELELIWSNTKISRDAEKKKTFQDADFYEWKVFFFWPTLLWFILWTERVFCMRTLENNIQNISLSSIRH